MKKISTLAFMAFFLCLSAMAQVELGSVQFTPGEGKKINFQTGKINVNFPKATVDGNAIDPATAFTIAGGFGESDDLAVFAEGTFGDGVTLEIADWGLEPATDYTLTISSVQVDGVECAAEGGYVLHFATRGAERTMSWVFTIDEESVAKIKADEEAGESGVGTYWSVLQENIRHYYHQRLNDDEIMLDANTPLPMTEGLTFTTNGADKIYVGDVVTTTYQKNLVFNNANIYVTIPDCKVGDIITFNGLYATKDQGSIQAMNGAALAPDGVVSNTTNLQDSVIMSGSAADYKFKSQIDGDITFLVNKTRMVSIKIEEGVEEVPRKYSVVAGYTENGETKVIKELVAETEGMAGSTIKVPYSMWIKDADGNLYSKASKDGKIGCVESLDLKSDTTFVVIYTKEQIDGVVYLQEAEDIEGAIACEHDNVPIRCSNQSAAYTTEDVKIFTLEPGSYKFRAILFDNTGKNSQRVCATFTIGEQEVMLSSNADNRTVAESDDLVVVDTATDVIWKAGGSNNYGLDVLCIYASTDAPDDPSGSGITEVENAQKITTRKVVKDGKIVIETEKGTFNVAGVQVK